MTARKTAGIGLVEVILAIAILGIVLVSIVPSFLLYLQVNTNSEIRSQAVVLAQQAMERLRLLDPSTLPKSGTYSPFADFASEPQPCEEESSACTRTADGRTFTVKASFCPDSPDPCSGNARLIRVEVDFNGRKVYEVETVYTKLR